MINQPGYCKSNSCMNCKSSIRSRLGNVFCNFDETGEIVLNKKETNNETILKWEEEHETKPDMICFNYRSIPFWK